MYSTTGCWIFASTVATERFYEGILIDDISTPANSWQFALAVCTLMTCFFGLLLLGFTGFHLYLIFTAKTTVELAKLERSPWDLGGHLENFQAVFGKSKLKWFLPLAYVKSTGYDFELAEEYVVLVREQRDRVLASSPPHTVQTGIPWEDTETGDLV
jgi:hypothetical protein